MSESPPSTAATSATAAEAALHHRTSLETRLKHVEEELRRWDDWDKAKALAAEGRPGAWATRRSTGRLPSLTRSTLDELRTMLTHELTELQGGTP